MTRAPSPITTLLSARVRGLVVNAEVRRDGVVHLRVRTQKQDCGLIGRIRQYLANALFRAADALHPGQNHNAVRVVETVVSGEAADDLVADRGTLHIVKGWTVNSADRNAQHETFLAYEGIKNEKLGPPADVLVVSGGKEGADDAHVASLKGMGTVQAERSRAYQSTGTSLADRLAHGPLSRHPGVGIALIVLLFGLADAIAPGIASLP
ncbi:hypothetical protein HI806_09145 [Ralstonia solanacearum]|nr:hypothetical protein HI806_09145 [Ralstonia solanacearum]QKL74982.1 hypothetical protein HI805_09155 [Ralstonia solanacearum]QKL80184.1 hypothetical protein HI804_09155 [Ralstonia solanacearum]QKL85396.1 hypothetical protein HI803_09160 [Ralstonia solanacearum]QKM00762.1 hypothetical protein HI800_09155 [Ralstonia solanacearum]